MILEYDGIEEYIEFLR